MDCYKKLDAIKEYLGAVRSTDRLDLLTDQRIIDFAKELGSEAASKYFGIIADTGAVDKLTDEKIMDFAKGLGSEAAKAYFRAIGSTKEVDILTDQRVIDFAKNLGPDTAEGYFKAIESTKAAYILTDEKLFCYNVIALLKELGPETAKEYFNIIGYSKNIQTLTDGTNTNFLIELGPEAAMIYLKIFVNEGPVNLITNKEIISFVKEIGPEAAKMYLGSVGREDAEIEEIKALANEKVLKQNVINFIKEIKLDVTKEYFKAIINAGNLDALTDKKVHTQNVINFVNKIGPEAAGAYFHAIAYAKSAEILTNEKVLAQNVINFVRELGPETAGAYFEAIGYTKAVEILTSEKILTQNVMNFVKGIRPEVAGAYFEVIGSTKEVEILTSEKFMDFAKELGPEAAGAYLQTIKTAKATDLLTSENFTTKELARLLKYLDADSRYFEAVVEINNPELLKRGAIAIAISTEGNENSFEYLIKSKGIIKDAIDYYDLLSKSLKNIGEMKDIRIKYDKEFCRLAMSHVKNGSATLLMHDIASSAYEINLKKLLNIDMNTFFSIGPNKIKQYVQSSISPVFEKFGIEKYKALDIEESFILLKDIEYIKNNSKRLNTFIERRINNLKQVSPFNNKEIISRVISEKEIGESKALEISQKTALETMVYAINGSRDMTNFDNAKKLLIESGYFQEKDISAVFGRWASIKGPYKKQLSDEFKNYLQNPSIENARKVIDVFKNAVAEKDIVIREPICDFIGKLEPLIIGGVKSIPKGDRVIAYVDNKDNIIKIKSSETGACCFIGGENEYAALRYAIEDGIAIINFTVTDSSITPEEFKKQKVHGAAICAFGRIGDNKKPVLLVDSFEGGITLNNALKNDYSIVVDALVKFAIDTGCEAIAINMSEENSTAVKFAEYIDVPVKISKIEILTKEKQYLETNFEDAQVKTIELSNYSKDNVAESNPVKILSELVR